MSRWMGVSFLTSPLTFELPLISPFPSLVPHSQLILRGIIGLATRPRIVHAMMLNSASPLAVIVARRSIPEFLLFFQKVVFVRMELSRVVI
jgi:hypothetical protein